MSLQVVTKLKLKTGASFKCLTIRPALLTDSNTYNFGEKYVTFYGNNINEGLAAEATRTLLLKPEEGDTDNNRFEFATGPVINVFPSSSLTPITGVNRFGWGCEYQLNGRNYSVFVGSVNAPSTILLAKEHAAFHVGWAYDDETEEAWFYILSENHEYYHEDDGTYTLRVSHITSNEYPTFMEWLSGAADYSTDPYEDIDPQPKPGGDGEPDPDPDPIDIPELPTLGAIDTGFVTLYTPTIQQLMALASYMWTGAFDLNNFKKIFADPMDVILGLSIVPCNVPSTYSKSVVIGNIDTGVTMNVVSQQYLVVDCGSLTVKEYWGSYLDYTATKIQIFLPYVGVRQLRTDDVMGKSINVVYHIDILSGSLVCFIKCGNSVLYEFNGQCSSPIPVTGNNWTEAIKSAVGLMSQVGFAAAGGALSPTSMVNNVMGLKPTIERAGHIGSTSGLLANQKPFLIIDRVRPCIPSNQNKFTGYPSFKTVKLSSVSGYTEVYSIHLDNVSATDEEKAEIESLLSGGVII